MASPAAAAPVPADGAVTHGEVGHAAEPQGLPQFDSSSFASQLFWLVLTFVFLYVYFSKVALPKLGQVLEERRDKIANDLDKAADFQQQTTAAIAAYEAALADARSKAQKIGQEMRDRLAEDTERQRQELETRLNGQLEAAEERIRATRDAAMANIKSVATDVTGAIVEKLAGRPGDGARIAQAVDAELSKRG